MSETTTDLITSSYYAAGVVSREFETVSGQQIGDGLAWLNDIITEKVVDDGMIPYETTYNFTAIPGQEKYFVPNLIQVDTLVFFLNSIRFAMDFNKRNNYFGSNRVENIQTLPYQWYFERALGGANIYIYFLPDRNYPLQVQGVFRIPTVTLGQDLTLIYDQFFITYLHYALADRICAEYNYETPSGVTRQLGKYESWINKKSRVLDLRVDKISSLKNQTTTYSWGYVNLGRGFTTGS